VEWGKLVVGRVTVSIEEIFEEIMEGVIQRIRGGLELQDGLRVIQKEGDKLLNSEISLMAHLIRLCWVRSVSVTTVEIRDRVDGGLLLVCAK
jgi:hypothetical protein